MAQSEDQPQKRRPRVAQKVSAARAHELPPDEAIESFRHTQQILIAALGIVATVFVGVFGGLAFYQGDRMDALAGRVDVLSVRIDGVVDTLGDIRVAVAEISTHMEYIRGDVADIKRAVVGTEPEKKASRD